MREGGRREGVEGGREEGERELREGGREGGRRGGRKQYYCSGCGLSHMTNHFLWSQSSYEICVFFLELLPEFVIILRKIKKSPH